MDIYLGANCSFCISTGSGFLSLCGIFGKPNAQITVPFAASHTHNENYLLMTKHHILKREKRELSLSELFSYGVAYAFDSKIYAQKGIELVENTPEEIKDLALEAADNFESTEKLTPEDEDLKNFFKELFAKNYKIANTTKDLNPLFWKNIHSEIKATYSKKFLKENKNWLR
jgi:putative glycosyltransferase (TIGR04372 family)